MKNHRLIDICKYQQKYSLKRKIYIAGISDELKHKPPLSAGCNKISTYLHDGDIDMESVVGLNLGISRDEVDGILSGTNSNAGFMDTEFHRKCATAHLTYN